MTRGILGRFPLRIVLLAVGVLSFGAFSLVYPASAQINCAPGLPCVKAASTGAVTTGSSGCDADFMNQLTGRAWLEVQRDLSTAQKTMEEPASVMEYTCFNSHLGATATNIGVLFSGTAGLKSALKGLVEPASRGNAGSMGSSYSCSMMNSVFTLSRCGNFGDNGGFVTLTELVSGVGSCSPPSNGAGVLNLAKNTGFSYVSYDKPPVKTTETCGAPIPTGLSVKQSATSSDIGGQTDTATSSSTDYVCPDPGCYYDISSKTCKK